MADGVGGDLRVCTTDELYEVERGELRRLLDGAFGSFDDQDWDHALGGTHAIVSEAVTGAMVAHAAVVPRIMTVGDRELAVGYVEAVACAKDARHRGYATCAMRAIDGVIAEQYELGALSTGVWDFYLRLGWERWQGPTYVATPAGRVRTADDDDGVMVLRTARTTDLDLTSAITCKWRAGDVW